MSGRGSWAAPVLALVLAPALSAGCGVRPTGTMDAGDAPVPAGPAVVIKVYLVAGNGRLALVSRAGLPADPYLAIDQLSVRPSPLEREKGLKTLVPNPLQVREVSPQGTMVIDELRPRGGSPGTWPRRALAQVACTAEAIPGVTGVRLTYPDTSEHRLSCADYQDLAL